MGNTQVQVDLDGFSAGLGAVFGAVTRLFDTIGQRPISGPDHQSTSAAVADLLDLVDDMDDHLINGLNNAGSQMQAAMKQIRDLDES